MSSARAHKPILRRLAALTTSVALGCTLVATTALGASAHPGHRSPNAAAKKAGITHEGEAYMGWSQNTSAPQPLSTQTSKTTAVSTLATVAQTPGLDVSSWQGNVNWASMWTAGYKFVYVKATEGTTYKNPYFGQQYTGSYNVGMIRGSYHFALPSNSSGAAQATYFAKNGGGWSRDGKTLPGVLDIEWNPYGATCYGKTQTQMRAWIADFVNTYKSLTGRHAVIYTATSWWNQCVGSTTQFAANNPLWIARYATSAGTLPTGWSYYTIWQHTDSPFDRNVFNGDLSRVKALALG